MPEAELQRAVGVDEVDVPLKAPAAVEGQLRERVHREAYTDDTKVLAGRSYDRQG